MNGYPLPAGRGDLLTDAGTNRSLLFDQGVGTYTQDGLQWTLGAEQKGQFLSEFASRFNGNLSAFLERRAKALNTLGARSFELVTQGRLVVGLGLPQPVETGFLLDRLTGCPYLPGSSVKGVLRHAARRVAADDLPIEGQPDATVYWRDNMRRLFGPEIEVGATPARGELACYDAFPNRWPTVEVDVLTPHQGAYYTGESESLPADWNDPTPVPFLTVAPGTRFVFHFRLRDDAPADEWKSLESLLRQGLEWLGIGGKTSSGYGVFGKEAPARSREIVTAALPASTPRRARRAEAPPPPPSPAPAQEVPWSNVTLTLHQGRPTVIRNRKPAATCAPSDLDPAVLAALKKHRELRADVVVVKLKGGPARLVRVTEWKA